SIERAGSFPSTIPRVLLKCASTRTFEPRAVASTMSPQIPSSLRSPSNQTLSSMELIRSEYPTATATSAFLLLRRKLDRRFNRFQELLEQRGAYFSSRLGCELDPLFFAGLGALILIRAFSFNFISVPVRVFVHFGVLIPRGLRVIISRVIVEMPQQPVNFLI